MRLHLCLFHPLKKRALVRQDALLLEHAGEGICGLDSNGRATFVNEAAAQILGHSRSDLLGKDLRALLPSSSLGGDAGCGGLDPITAALDGGAHSRGNYTQVIRADGSAFPLEYVITSLPGKDRPGIIQVLGEQLEAETLFRVVDNGRGIPAERCDAIFEVFGRAGIEDVPGEGMGLAYVQSLVRRLGGRIWCDSELGRGSRFSVAIPTSMNKRGLPPFIT